MEIDILEKRYKKIDKMDISLADKIKMVFEGFEETFNLDLIYQIFKNEKQTTIRGRVYRDLMGKGQVVRLAKGVYKFHGQDQEEGLILEGDARKLDLIKNQSVHLVIADHPYQIAQGGNRSFNDTYKESTFEYTEEDFKEKARVLVDGGFLVEFLPEMKETNWEYLNKILEYASNAGFNFFAKVPWYKAQIINGKLIDRSANVGRKSVLEDVYVFSKGKPRSLRTRLQGKEIREERGANGMLPAIFMDLPEIPKNRRHKAEKPTSLLKKLVNFFTKESEIVLDQFAGSFNAFYSALELKRKAIAIELNPNFVPIVE